MSDAALPYDQLGAGPAVVLLHAGVAGRAMWSEQLEPIAREGYRVVALDMPGFGDAPPVAGPPFLDVLATLDALLIERATLVGNSFGGFVALCAAVTAPSRFDGLVLASAPSPQLVPSPALEAAWAAQTEALERARRRRGRARRGRRCVDDAGRARGSPRVHRRLAAPDACSRRRRRRGVGGSARGRPGDPANAEGSHARGVRRA